MLHTFLLKRTIKTQQLKRYTTIKQYLLEPNSVKKQLQSKISFVDFCNICTLFLNINNKKLSRAKSIQNKKLSKIKTKNKKTLVKTQ